MARNLSVRPLRVTAVARRDGRMSPGHAVTSAQDARDWLLGGPRLTDGVHVESSWSDLICDECGESAAWCFDLMAALPMSWIAAKRDEESATGSIFQHVDGLVTFAS